MKSIPPSRGLIRKLLGQYWLLSLGLLIVLTWQNIGILTSYVDHSRFVKLETMLEELAVGALEICASVVVSVLVFSYLHNKRKSCFFQSIPCTRDQLFLCSYGSGIALYALPLLLSTVFGILNLLLLKSSVLIPALLQATAYRLFMYITFYSFSVMGMILSGRTFFGILSALFLATFLPIMEGLFYAMTEPLLFGVTVGSDLYTSAFCPLTLLSNFYYGELDMGQMLLSSCTFVLISLALSFLALFLHRKRQEEAVGQSLVFFSVLSIVQVFLTLLFSYLLAALFLLVSMENLTASLMVPMSIPAFFLVRMFLLRSKKVFQKKAIIGCVIYVLVLSGLLLSLRYDVFGIVRKVPEAPQVQEARISLENLEYTSRDAEDIQDILELHKEIIENRSLLKEEEEHFYDAVDISLRITYTLGRGKTITRCYSLYCAPASVASAMFTEIGNDFFRQDSRPQTNLQTLEEKTLSASFLGEKSDEWINLSTLQIRTLFHCMKEDLSAGIDPLFVYGKYTENSLSVELKFFNTGYKYIYIPKEATATTAFLEEIDRQSIPAN